MADHIISLRHSVHHKTASLSHTHSLKRHYPLVEAHAHARSKLLPLCPLVLSCSRPWALFEARRKQAATAQQKLNCILQLHIEKLNVENCCRFRHHSSHSERLVFFSPNFWHTFHLNRRAALKLKQMRKEQRKKSFCRRASPFLRLDNNVDCISSTHNQNRLTLFGTWIETLHTKISMARWIESEMAAVWVRSVLQLWAFIVLSRIFIEDNKKWTSIKRAKRMVISVVEIREDKAKSINGRWWCTLFACETTDGMKRKKKKTGAKKMINWNV